MTLENDGKKEMKPRKMSGQRSLFRGKVRRPVTLALTPDHHEKVSRNKARLGLTRADFIALLIEKYADDVQLDQSVEKDGGCVMGNSTRQAA